MLSHKKNTILLDANKEEDINFAINLLKEDKLVALPTETVYGLAANGFKEEAIEKIYLAKNRPAKNPLILHVKSLEDAFKLYDILPKNIEEKIHKLALKFWPGPLTIIAKKSNLVPNIISAGLDTVAVRVPSNKTTLNILANIDFPLAMPSANISTRPSPTNYEHVLLTLNGLIDAVIKEESSEIGIESTVVDLSDTKSFILRLGKINLEEISSVLNEEVFLNTYSKTPKSPGQSFLHYSPKVKASYFIEEEFLFDIWNKDCLIILTEKQYNYFYKNIEKRNLDITFILSDDFLLYTKNIYNILYECEKYPDKILYIVNPSNNSNFDAVKDRIKRAVSMVIDR